MTVAFYAVCLPNLRHEAFGNRSKTDAVGGVHHGQCHSGGVESDHNEVTVHAYGEEQPFVLERMDSTDVKRVPMRDAFHSGCISQLPDVSRLA
jgi:hypothetical protein